MNDEQIKQIWAETISAEDLEGARTGVTYGLRSSVDDTKRPVRLPLATVSFPKTLGGGVVVRRPASELSTNPDEEPSAEEHPAEVGPDASGKDASGKDASGKDASGKDASGKDASGTEASLSARAHAHAESAETMLHEEAGLPGLAGLIANTDRTVMDTMAADTESPSHSRDAVTARVAHQASGEHLRDLGESFLLTSEIGRGGMGIVYRAVQGSLEREVAIKTLIPERATEAARQKFLAEALVTGALDHPNVIPVHELAHNEDGDIFLAMKLVHGHAWQDLLHPRTDAHREAAKPMHLRRHIDVLIDVCNAVSFAHSKGILHRDLKPENVMVGAYGETVLMDWGIAVDFRDPKPENLRAPHKSDVYGPAGTPVYMAPELAMGRGAELGPWTDVYLLGAILHEIVTNEPPHQGATLLDTLKLAALSEPQTYGDDVPNALSSICLRAMATERSRRYQSVEEFAEALRLYLAHAEALRLADEADDIVADLRRPDAVAAQDRYATWARALARYDQSLLGWPDNEQALRGQAEAALEYAEEALSRQDTGLADAQMGVLQDNTHADAARVRSLSLALARSGRGRIRSVGAFIAIAGIALLAWQGMSSVREQAAKDRAQKAALSGFDRKAQEVWQAVATHDILKVSREETRLTEDPIAQTTDGRERLKAMRGAKKLMLWRQGRWRALFAFQCQDVRAKLLKKAGSKLAEAHTDPLLAQSPAGALLARIAEDTSGRGACVTLEDELSSGTPPATVIGAFEAWERAALGAVPTRKSGRMRLLEASVCGIAKAEALPAEATATLAGCADKVLPYGLARPPFGPTLPPPHHQPPLMRRGALGEWVALDPRSRTERWRTLPPGVSADSEVVVPIADGSIIVAAGPFLERHDGRTGAVLARVELASRALVAWPDPVTRSALQVVAWSNRDQGRVAIHTFMRGKALGRIYRSDTIPLFMRPSPRVTAWRKRLVREASAHLDIPAKHAAKDPAVRREVFSALMAAAGTNPYEPDLPLGALEFAADAIEPARRKATAKRVVAASRGLLPLHTVSIASRLERQGFPDEADALYDNAANDFVDAHGNADLAALLIGNPAFALRALGGSLFATNPERALGLVDRSHRFATVLEGDASFYQRYKGWLEAQGREDPKVDVRLARSAEAGAFAMLSPSAVLLTDLSIVLFVLLPLILAILVLRLWYVAGPTRRAALYAHGLRTSVDRFTAFLSDPWLRLRHTFWSYCSRPLRLVLFVGAALILGAASLLTSNLSALTSATSAPLHQGFGYPGHPAYLADVRRAIDRKGQDPALLRLLAEGFAAQRRTKDARKTLEALLARDPKDAIAANNLGVLDERAGNEAAARERYKAASIGLARPGATVARYNLTRLAGDPPDPAPLAHRDALRAERFGPETPLWALCPFADQRRLLVPPQTVAERAIDALSSLLTGDIGAIAVAFGENATTDSGLALVASAAGALAVLCCALSLIWLPLPVLPLLPTGPAPTKRTLGARAAYALRLTRWFIPGVVDLLSDRRTLGAALMLLSTLLLGLYLTTDRGGLLGTFFDLAYFRGYFPGVKIASIHFPYRWWGRIAGALLAALVLWTVARNALAAGAAESEKAADPG